MATVNEAFAMLTQTDEVTELRTRHRDFYLALAERADRELRGPEQAAWLDMLDANRDNLRAALDWSVARGDDETLRLCGALLQYWSARGDHFSPDSGEPAKWLERALAATDGLASPARSRALAALGWFAWFTDPDRSAQLLEDAVALARESGDARAICQSLLAASGFRGGWQPFTTPDTFVQVQEALAVARASGDPILLGDALYARACAGHAASAAVQPILREAHALYRDAGDARMAALVSSDLGFGALNEDSAASKEYLLEAVATARRLKEPAMLWWAVLGLAERARCVGDYATTRAALDGAVGLLRQWSRWTWHYPLTLKHLGDLAVDFGDHATARAAFEELLAVAPEGDFEALACLAFVAQAEGDEPAAIGLARDAVRSARDKRWPRAHCLTLTALGEVAQAQGDLQTAREALAEAHAFLPLRVDQQEFATRRALRALGELARAEADLEGAEALFEELMAKSPESLRQIVETQDRIGRVARLRGDFERAAELHRRSLADAHRVGLRVRSLFSLD